MYLTTHAITLKPLIPALALSLLAACAASDPVTSPVAQQPPAQAEAEPSPVTEPQDTSNALTKERLSQLATASFAAIKNSEVASEWAQSSGDATLAWFYTAYEGPENHYPAAMSVRSRLESDSVNGLNVAVNDLNSIATMKGYTIGEDIGHNVADLAKVGADLGVDYIATNILIQDASGFSSRVLVVDSASATAVVDSTVR